MADETELAISSAMHDMRQKYIYFLLTATGACIGFTVTQTRGVEVSAIMVPLAIAVACWAGSFFCGCRALYWKPAVLGHNIELLHLRYGLNPIAGSFPERIRLGEKIITEHHDEVSRRAARYMRWQFCLFIIASGLFLLWHVLEMFSSTFGVSVFELLR